MGDWLTDLVMSIAEAEGNKSSPYPVRREQLQQYRYGTSGLPDQSLRPTALTRQDQLQQPFKSLRAHYPSEIIMPDVVAGMDINKLQGPMRIPMPTAMLTAAEAGRRTPVDLADLLGLGNATASVGKDEKGAPFLSIYDSWDFKKGAQEGGYANKPAFGLEFLWNRLRNAGHPFSVYDRIPLKDPTMPGKVPYTLKNPVPVGGDIDLPPLQRAITRKRK